MSTIIGVEANPNDFEKLKVNSLKLVPFAGLLECELTGNPCSELRATIRTNESGINQNNRLNLDSLTVLPMILTGITSCADCPIVRKNNN